MRTIEGIKKELQDIITFASTPRERFYYKFSAPSLNWLASGGRDYRGIRSGTLIEIVGAKSSGKSTIALDLVANAQAQGKTCLWIDLERWFDPSDVGEYATAMGVDTQSLYLARPKTSEQALEIAERAIDSGIDLIVLDSIAALVPENEWEKNYDDPYRLGEVAQLVKRFIQRASILADDTNTVVVMLNQIRSNITSMPGAKSTKRFGGKVFEHHLHQAYELTAIEHKDAEHWKKVSVFLEKNRIGGMERLKRELVVSYGKGFRTDIDTLMCAVTAGIVDKKGAWYYYPSQSDPQYKAHGEDNATAKLPLDQIKEELERH